VKHVFIIVLENKSFRETFETGIQDPYLQKTLVPMGATLAQYYGVGHLSLENYISVISGQAPTQDTANDCLASGTGSTGNYTDVQQIGIASNGQVVAKGGCVYPRQVQTLADQLQAAGLTWKAYMEDMGNDPSRESATCGHPSVGMGTDNTNEAEAPSAAVPQGDAYATRHNPFMYFHSIIDSPSCQKLVVNLNYLRNDLAREADTPNLVFITPNLCHDAHDGLGTGAPNTTCASGEPGGLTSADEFLRNWVPRILNSDAFRKDGLLIITFDESDYTLTESRNTHSGQVTMTVTFPGRGCCNQQPGPNLSPSKFRVVSLTDTPALVQNIVINGYGGDRTGALILSPFVRPGSKSNVSYNHYSLLRSLEDIFGLKEHLGYAADDPSIGYRLDTIGNDRSIFRSD